MRCGCLSVVIRSALRFWEKAVLWLWLAILAAGLSPGCSSHSALPAPSASAAAEAMPAGPEAKIHVSYAHPDDFLTSLTVTKYSAAQPLKTIPTKDGDAMTVRFEGGLIVWQFDVEKGLLAGVPVVGGKESRYAPPEVKYGELPQHFAALIPDSGPPEPLESGHYYVFAVTRGSGSMSYEVAKVNADGSLEAFEADPRAGSSFWLCCNLPGDFVISAD